MCSVSPVACLEDRSFISDLNPVAVRIGGEDVGLPRDELSLFQDFSTRPLHCNGRSVDVLRLPKTEPEVCDALHLSRLGRVLLEGEDVVTARRLGLDRPR